jgi:glycosyltransferase involved in cell wall biosynthesis
VRVSFIVPVHNEAATLGDVIAQIETLPFDLQVVVVDDGSTDASAAIAEDALACVDGCVIRQANRGKGAAVRAASRHVDGDIVVIQDADMEYDPPTCLA